MSHDDGPELLSRWRAGDREAGEVLIDRHFGEIFRFFCRRFAERERCRDLAQRTFATTLAAVERLRDGERLRAYLFGVAHNLLRHEIRDGKRRDGLAHKAELLPREATSPSVRFAAVEERRILLLALEQLPLDLQLTVELFYWEGLSTQEVAEILGVPRGTVKWRLSEARDRLRGSVEDLTRSGADRDLTHGFQTWAARLHDVLSEES
jgi:RNA polymerase sigma-70 factor (ECF subfamily)